MVGQIKTVNGVKKIVPLTAEARAGNPVSTIIAIYSNLVPYGYLPCNGVQFDETRFPALYAILGDNHTPDLRECALVGAGQNATDTIATHDVYTVGQFKDDQLQEHRHGNPYTNNPASTNFSKAAYTTTNTIVGTGESSGGVKEGGRVGTTTHGKQKGINYCIKATAGLDESDADYVLGVLAPVDEVTVDNMHSVTSNAVAQKLQSIENLTSLLTPNSTYCNYINCFRYGKVVDVYFETKNTSQSNATIATGLPAPKSGYMMYGIEIYGNGSITYTRVESNGNLIAQCNSSYTGIGHITYICS